MKTIGKNTKLGQHYLRSYDYSKMYNIYQAYARPSAAKVEACEECFDMCREEGGRDFKIISAGCQFFSVAWTTDEGLRVETALNSYIIK